MHTTSTDAFQEELGPSDQSAGVLGAGMLGRKT